MIEWVYLLDVDIQRIREKEFFYVKAKGLEKDEHGMERIGMD